MRTQWIILFHNIFFLNNSVYVLLVKENHVSSFLIFFFFEAFEVCCVSIRAKLCVSFTETSTQHSVNNAESTLDISEFDNPPNKKLESGKNEPTLINEVLLYTHLFKILNFHNSLFLDPLPFQDDNNGTLNDLDGGNVTYVPLKLFPGKTKEGFHY